MVRFYNRANCLGLCGNRDGLPSFLKGFHLWAKPFYSCVQRIIRKMERDFDTGYETGYKLQLTEDDSLISAIFDCKSRFNV